MQEKFPSGDDPKRKPGESGAEQLSRLADMAEKVGEGAMAVGFCSDIELVTKSSGPCTLTAGLGWQSS